MGYGNVATMSIDTAAMIVHARQGAELIARVFECWDAWGARDDEEEGNCPGCGSCVSSQHEHYCWFAEAASWLRAIKLPVPSLFDFGPTLDHARGNEQTFDE